MKTAAVHSRHVVMLSRRSPEPIPPPEKKGLILVARESEFSGDPRREKFKSARNRLMGHRIEIIAYDAILRYVRSEVEFKENRL